MAQNQNIGLLGQVLTVNTAANTSTITNALVVGNSSVNVVINSSSVYVSGSPLGGATNTAAQYTWTNTQTFSNTITFSGAIVSTNTISANGGVGTAGQVLTSAGAGSNVYWTAAAAGTNVAAQYAWTNTQTFSNTITFSGNVSVGNVLTIGNSTVNTYSNSTHFYSGNTTVYGYGNNTADVLVSASGNLVLTATSLTLSNTTAAAVSLNTTSMAVNAFSIGSSNTATFYNINGQANVAAGAFVGNAYATLGGASGNYLAFGQQTSSAQWIQSGYSSAGAPVYYSILLNPLGGNIGIGNNAPVDRLSVNGTTYLGGNTTVTGNTTVVNVYSTGTINAAAHTVGTSFISNTTQLTIATPVSANGGVGTAGQVLTSNGATGSPYWATSSGGGGFTNGQSISVSNLAITGALTASGGVGTTGQVLTSNGSNVYWSSTSAATTALRQSFTGDGSTTVFTISGGYTAGAIDVFVNGLRFRNGTDVTVTSGTTITFAVAPPSGALIDVVATTATTYSSITPATYSVQFSGSSNYLSVPNINFGANNFTVEGWFYPTSVASLINFFGTDNGSGTIPKFIFYINGSNLVLDTGSISGTALSTPISNITINAWNHIAIVRSGTSTNQTALYINGVSKTTGAVASMSSITQPFNIGYIGEAYGTTFAGYISNFRIVNGAAVYTGNFTPIGPLTAVQAASGTAISAISANQTVLLTCNGPTIVDGSNSPLTITNTGAATASTTVGPLFTSVTINNSTSVNLSDTFVSVFLLGL